LINALTGSSASAQLATVLPTAANLPNSHNSNSGLCGARRRARPTGAHRSLDSRSNSSSRVTLESLAPDRFVPQHPGRQTFPGEPEACHGPDDAATAGGRRTSERGVRWVRVLFADDA